MRPMSVTRRVMEAKAKLQSLATLPSHSRLEEHALAEAVLHQLAVTWLALVRQVGDAHGIKPTTIDSLEALVVVLNDRGLPSLEVNQLKTLAEDPDSWWSEFVRHRESVMCPPEPMASSVSDAIPLTDRSGLEAIQTDRYRPWVSELVDLIESLQGRFHES